jgi:hypothetical protein
MPVGSLIQLAAYGAQNQYLNGNPQFTYFRGVFRRHTNFAMEMIELPSNGHNELSLDKTTQLSVTIDRNGDLVSNVYFVFELPDIYSSYNPAVSFEDVEKSGYQFQWIDSIGTNMINSCQLIIGGKVISQLYGEWIRIWHEMFCDISMKNFDEMIGNVPELFAPKNSIGSTGVYPTSSLQPTLNRDPEIFTQSQYISNPYLKPPSIKRRTITVPLNFFFQQSFGLALPLIALQYHEVVIQIELKPLLSLYTIIDNRIPKTTTFGQRIIPNISEPLHSIQNFISLIDSNTFTYGENLSAISNAYVGWGFNPRLQVNYIFLDEDERKRFADVTHEYLIEQVVRLEYTSYNTSNATINLTLQNPVKELLWMVERDDFSSNNIFGNYTNWPLSTIDPGSLAYIRNTIGETTIVYTNVNAVGVGQATLVDTAWLAFEAGTIPQKFNFNYFQKYPILQSSILFNGQERFSTQKSSYFQNTQVYQHGIRNVYEGIHLYSFALEPTKFQPSGSCNMSRIHSVQLKLNFASIPTILAMDGTVTPLYQYNVIIYSVNYNIFRVLAGMGGLAFVS